MKQTMMMVVLAVLIFVAGATFAMTMTAVNDLNNLCETVDEGIEERRELREERIIETLMAEPEKVETTKVKFYDVSDEYKAELEYNSLKNLF